MNGVSAVITNRAQDQARSAAQSMSALQKPPAASGAANDDAIQGQQVTPLAPSSRRWSVRVHWGIIFAIAASFVLWFVIATVARLVF